MFGVGFFEALIIAAVALLILGPEQFPKFAKMAARFVRDVRSYANEVQTEIAKDLVPLSKELNDLRRMNPEKYLDKLIKEDEEDTRPPNPEPHPSEVDLGAPIPGNYQTATATAEAAPATAPEAAVPYGTKAAPEPVQDQPQTPDYPQEEGVPPTPQPKVYEPERLDG